MKLKDEKNNKKMNKYIKKIILKNVRHKIGGLFTCLPKVYSKVAG